MQQYMARTYRGDTCNKLNGTARSKHSAAVGLIEQIKADKISSFQAVAMN